jgi:hypothetical protein
MPRAKKHPELSADERAFHNRLDCLNEEEIKQLTTREIFAYFKIIENVVLAEKWPEAQALVAQRTPLQVTGRGRNYPPRQGIFSAAPGKRGFQR